VSYSYDDIVDALESVAQYGVPSPGTAPIIDVGTADFLSLFENEILGTLLDSGGGTCRIYEGVYGSGKTHFLDLVTTLALKKGMAVVRNDLSQGINLDNWKGIVANILKGMVVNVEGQKVESLPRILEALSNSKSGLGTRIRKKRFPHSGFSTAMATYLERTSTPRGLELLERYLEGERIGALMLRDHRIEGVSDPLSKRNAEQVLATVVAAFVEIEIPGCIVLFDEHEKSLVVRGSRPSKKIIEAANLFRRLIDASVGGGLPRFIAVFTVLPDFLDRCGQAYEALGQRTNRPPRVYEESPWRWPALELIALGSANDNKAFAGKAVLRMLKLIDACGGDKANCKKEMESSAKRVLQSHEGAGFRRPLMKQLATIALEEISP